MAHNAALRREVQAAWGTLPQAARHFGLGVKLIRRKAREGAFPVYDAATARPRVAFAEVERWLRSTRVVVKEQTAEEHAQRVAEARLRHEEEMTA